MLESRRERAAMQTIPISQVDALFSRGLYPIEFGFYYRKAFRTKGLRAALRRISAPFWPLFGEFERGHLRSLPYREGEHYGEESLDQDLDLSRIAVGGWAAYSQFKLPDLKSLFFLKVTRLRNGLLIVPKMSHLAGDGYSYFYALSLLAALTRRRWVPFGPLLLTRAFKPHHRRTALAEFVFKWTGPHPAPEIQASKVEEERMSRERVQALVEEAAGAAGRAVSANDVIAAWVLKKTAACRDAFRERELSLTIPIDVRRRVKEYGPKFFGNGIWLHSLKLEREEVERSSISDLAARVRSSMPRVTAESYLGYLRGIERTISEGGVAELAPFDPAAGVLVTNLSKLPLARLDFGGGPPDLVLPLTTGRNAAAILAGPDGLIVQYAL